ncbi:MULTISPECIES: hypothetical protein [Methylomonas]|uniref:hypothetical protein n=1 Tax=Methylomonas TaxID=416 RepID=UPI0012322AB3|nr:hypothetical protein [Methylomonas rhizoryzae]
MAQRQQAADALNTVENRLPLLIASHDQAAKMLDLAKLACSERVEALRAQLQPDAECPVCGAKQHPFAEHDHPLRQELQILASEVETCRHNRQQAEQERQRWQLDIAQCDKTLQAGDASLAALHRQIEPQRHQWSATAAELAALDIADEGMSAWLAGEIQATEQDLHALAERLKAMSAALTARDRARQTPDRLKSDQQALQQQLDQAASDRQAAQQALLNAREKRQALTLQNDSPY